MPDEFQGQRLPDLPHAGYTTRTQRELSDAMMFVIRGFERDRLLLLETVIQGRAIWRKRFVKAFKAIKADDEFADAVFGYFVLLAGPNPEAQKAQLEQQAQQRQIERWDKRLATQFRHAKDRRLLRDDIVKDVIRRSKRPHSVS